MLDVYVALIRCFEDGSQLPNRIMGSNTHTHIQILVYYYILLLYCMYMYVVLVCCFEDGS